MSDTNKNVIRRVFEEVWNKGNVSALDELVGPNLAHHDPSTPDFGHGPEGEKRRVNLYRSAFPDLHFTVEDVIADGDRVVARYTARGTHKGELNGIAPTGKHINVSGVTVSRIANGKIAESWVNWDALGMMQQLGIVPEHAAKSKVAAK